MSNTHSPEFDRHGQWRRWQMEELLASQAPDNDCGQGPT
ncbi:MAG: flagellar assembly protein FliH, partial [Halomonas sp.]|nr:flagellar assembly protein FliH [Halomonas sp.]